MDVEIQGKVKSARLMTSLPDGYLLVLLQAMKEDPPLDARCRDKFLVQSVPISPDQDIGNIAAIVSVVLPSTFR